MRRTAMVLAAAAIMVTVMVASALPALAQSVTTPPVDAGPLHVGPGEVGVGGVTPPPVNVGPLTGDVSVGDVNVGPLTGDGDQPLSHTAEDVTVQCVANDPLFGPPSLVNFGGGDSCADDGGTVNQGGLF